MLLAAALLAGLQFELAEVLGCEEREVPQLNMAAMPIPTGSCVAKILARMDRPLLSCLRSLDRCRQSILVLQT